MWLSLWSRAGNSHVLRRALRLDPATWRGPQPHPAGGCGQVQQVTPRSAGAKKAHVSSLEFECIQRTSGEGDFTSRASTWRPRSRFIGAMEATPKTMAWECLPEGKHSQLIRKRKQLNSCEHLNILSFVFSNPNPQINNTM